MGVVAAGRGAGYFIVPVFAVLVSFAGWREALVIVAILILVVGLALALIVRDRPEQYGLRPDGDSPIDTTSNESSPNLAPSSLTGMSVTEVLRGRAFYLLTISTGLTAGQSVAWTVHQIPHMQNVGFSLTTASLVVAIYGLVQVTIRPFIGWLADVIGRHRLYIASFILQGIGLFAFAHLSTDRLWILPVYYLTYATGHAIWVILFITAVADYFGARRFGTLQGLTSTLIMPFGVLGPLLAGIAFDEFGSYQLIFSVYAPLTAVAALFVIIAGEPKDEPA
jgi:sugar phosphate permease